MFFSNFNNSCTYYFSFKIVQPSCINDIIVNKKKRELDYLTINKSYILNYQNNYVKVLDNYARNFII